MFGRRNTEPLPPAAPRRGEAEIDLDMLPDLPEILPAPASPQPAPGVPASDDSAFERAWATDGPGSAIAATIPESTPFVPTPPASSAPFAAASAPSAAKTRATTESVIGPDDFFDGNYRSERGVRLQGNVRGSIESRQYILVESGANVEASLSAEDITVSGDFSGAIECRHRLEVTATGRIHGQVTTALLVVQEGGVLDGELHMRRDAAEETEHPA